MSEYQYYEFQAIDRPLDERAMAELRSLTSRATITPNSLVNVYHFGSFKGKPDRLMEQYFDAHLYVANWGTRRLMFRLPARAFDLEAARPYLVPDMVRAWTTKDLVLLDFVSRVEGGGEWEEGQGWLPALIPLRSDLLAGDLRCLYLAWLGGVEVSEVDEDVLEPPVPPGLRQLSGPLRKFAEFLRIDPDLIEVSAAASTEEVPGWSPEDLRAWVAALPTAEKNKLLVQLMEGEGVTLAGELLHRFRKDRAPARAASPAPRKAGELLEARDGLEEEKRRQAAERAAQEEERRRREQVEARSRHLDTLAGREKELWRQVEEAIATRQPKEYDQAVKLLEDLRDLGQRGGSGEDVARRIRKLREQHRNKRTLIQRMDKAGLPE